MVTRGKAIEVLAYVAGVIDSDGYIGINRTGSTHTLRVKRHWSPRFQVEVVVTNTCKEVLEWLASEFGGSIMLRKAVKPHHKATYRWKVGDLLASQLVEQVLPYLRIKPRQAEILLQFAELKRTANKHGKGARLSEEKLAQYEAIHQRFKALNDDRRPQRLSGAAPDVATTTG